MTKKLKLKINDHLIEHRTIVKYLGVYLDQNLTYEPEVKHLLKKMVCGIKTLYCVRELLPEKICLSLLNALVISHLHYPALLLNGISQNLITTLENQLSWGIKACCNRNKYEFSSDLKLKHEFFPVNSNKPLGPSNIPAWALKDSVDIIGEPLTFLINAFLHEGRFPNHLKRAHVVPKYKSGDIEDPTNYRPISITSALSKVFEKVIQNQIVEFLDDTKLLSPHQFGFRANFSTADALLYATEKIRFDIDNKNVVAAAFLDLSKAFDSISHEILLQKLHNLNFSENSIAMIRSFLKRRLQKVVLETTSSDWIELYQGVPQGTILGPLLFNIYVNSMRYSVSKPCELVQYADDTFIFVSGKKNEDAINLLEKNAKCLVDFFHRHRLNLNDKKLNLSFSAENPRTV